MKIPYSWLKDYAEVNVDPHTLGDKKCCYLQD